MVDSADPSPWLGSGSTVSRRSSKHAFLPRWRVMATSVRCDCRATVLRTLNAGIPSGFRQSKDIANW